MAFGGSLESRRGPFGHLQREIDGLFNAMLSRFGGGLFSRACPPVNVYEDADAVVVECELPGADHDSIEVFATGDVLTLKGERPALEPDDQTTVHIQERRYGAFNRSITLPLNVDSEKVEARYDNGILSIRLPKAAEARPRQVKVREA